MEMTLDERERLSLTGDDKERKKKEKKAKKRSKRDCDKQAMIPDDESKKKFARLQEEVDEMRKTIKKLTSVNDNKPVKKSSNKNKYALDFDPEEYLSLGFIASANWIAEKIAKNMRERMMKADGRWEAFKKMRNSEMRSMVPCVSFNRGEGCRLGSWHTTLKKMSSTEHDISRRTLTREELRVHCCTLCLKALGVLCTHSVIDCPWTLEENWE